MKNQSALLLIGAGVIVFYLLYQKQQAQQQLLRRTVSPGVNPRFNGPNLLGSAGSDSLWGNIGKTLGGLFQGLTNNTAKGNSSGGSGVSGGSGAGAAGGPGQNQGRLNNQTDQSPAGRNFGSYWGLDGQLYDANGQALDDNGRTIPGQFDNTGTGPAGAGINQGGTLASNPLEFTDTTSPMFGVVAPLNTGAWGTIPVQNGSGADIQALVAASQAAGVPAGSAPQPVLDSTPIGTGDAFWNPPSDIGLTLIPDPSITAPDTSGTANWQDTGLPSDSAITSPIVDSSGVPNMDTTFGFPDSGIPPETFQIPFEGDTSAQWNDMAWFAPYDSSLQ